MEGGRRGRGSIRDGSSKCRRLAAGTPAGHVRLANDALASSAKHIHPRPRSEGGREEGGGEEEGRRRTWPLWHHQGRECQNSCWNIEVEYMGRVSDSQPIFRVPDPVPRELATLLAPQ